jgi:hypothetical protein
VLPPHPPVLIVNSIPDHASFPMIDHDTINGWVGIVRSVVGAVLVMLSFSLAKSWAMAAPGMTADFNDVFGLALFAASALAAGWLLVKYRRGMGKGPARDHDGPKPAGSTGDNGDASESGERYATLRWFVRIGGVASAIVLTALVVGKPVLVIHVVALGMVAIAFALILILTPRGL